VVVVVEVGGTVVVVVVVVDAIVVVVVGATVVVVVAGAVVVVGVDADAGSVTWTAPDHWLTADLLTERTRTLYVPPGTSEPTTCGGRSIPRMRTGLGTFVPEYVKSYDVAEEIGFHVAVSAVVEVGTADSVVIFVRVGELSVARPEDPAPARPIEVMTTTAAVVSEIPRPRRTAAPL